MAGSTSETPVLELLQSMTGESVLATSLDDQAMMLVRIASLVAVDAPVFSYRMNLEAAAEVGIDVERIRGVLTAIAPIVGTTRIVSATEKIGEALELESERF
jgi:alkylhydroperoxidase/carboxymuconolactone decarboxylase family protein YurZ